MRVVQREREAERETPRPGMREKRKAERQTEPQREARGEREKWIRSQMRTEPQRARSLAERDSARGHVWNVFVGPASS